jgi:tetratricopeptide (TPR) repeat protein
MPASGVNKRFVFILVGTLAAIAAVVTLAAVYVTMKDGERNIRQGDTLAAAGRWRDAAQAYSRGVNKDQTRADWMEKWRDAIRKVVPENSTVFNQEYGNLRGVTLKIAQTKKTDVAAYESFFGQVLEEFASLGASTASWSAVESEVDKALATFEIAKIDPSTGWGALRRFRGMALVGQFAQDSTLDPQKIALAKSDLEAGLAQRPNDLDSMAGLVQWHLLSADRASKTGQSDEAARLNAEAIKILGALADAHSKDPKALAMVLRFHVGISNRSVASGATSSEVIEQRHAKLTVLRPQLDRLVQAIQEAPPASLAFEAIEPVLVFGATIDPKDGAERGAAAMARALTGRPDDAELLLLSARQLAGQRKFEEAIARFQQVADMPNKPVGLDGLKLLMYKNVALTQQASASLGLVAGEDDPVKRAAGLERVRGYRQKLASQTISAQSPELLLLDAKIKIAEGDRVTAQQLLAEHGKKTGDRGADAVESLVIRGGIAMELGELGRAREAFAKALEINPAFNLARMGLADALERLGEDARALEHYREALRLDPGNDGLRNKIQVLEALVNRDAGAVKDPVARVLVEAQLLLMDAPGKPADPAKARALVELNLEAHAFDRRLVLWFLQQLMAAGNVDAAIRFMEGIVGKAPPNEEFNSLLAQLRNTRNPDEAIKAVKARALAPGLEAVEIFRVLKTAGRGGEGVGLLKEAFDAGHPEPMLFEAYFVAAFEAGDLATAQMIVRKAKDTNIDKVAGRTFEARLAMMQGKLGEAEVMLRQLAEGGAAAAPIWRLLAACLQAQNRAQDAIAAAEQGLKIQPNDMELNKLRLRLLDDAGQGAVALAEATRLEPMGRGDREFIELLIVLQTRAGDRAGALARREAIHRDTPGDQGNALALAELYLDDRQNAKADAILATIPVDRPGTILPMLRARSLAEQSQMPKAREVMDQMLAAYESAKITSIDPYLAYARFLTNFNQNDEALAMCDRAAAIQDPSTRQADLVKGDLLNRFGRPKEAAEVYRGMLGAGLVQPTMVRARLVRTLMVLRELDQAERELAQAGDISKNLELLTLRSQVLEERGDLRGARAALDAAVAAFPGDARTYVRRASLLIGDPVFVRDAMADLDMAVKLEPKSPVALQARGAARFQAGDIEGGLGDFGAAANADPSNVALRLGLVNELLNRGREAEAVKAAGEGVSLNTSNLGLAVQLGDTFASRRLWARAQAIYGDLWRRTKSPPAAERYVSSLLRADQPQFTEVEQVLGSPEAKTNEYWGLLLLRAELRAKQGNEKAAQGDALAALDLAAKDPKSVIGYYDAIRGAFSAPGQARRIIEGFARVPAGAEFWLALYSVRLRFDELATVPGGITPAAIEPLLASLTKSIAGAEALQPRQPSLLFVMYKVASDLHMAIGRAEEAVASGRQALQFSPNDAMLNNNVAYLLADQLNKADEALVFAEKAVQIDPNRADILDTLGTVYLKLNQPEKAIGPLRRSVGSARTTHEKAYTGAKLVRALALAGKKDAARESLAQVRTWRSDPTASKRVSETEIEELNKLVER